MKFNKIFLAIMVLAVVATLGIVAAEDATVGPYTFTIPDGYTVAQTGDNLLAMQMDEYNAMSFATDVSDDIESAKQSFIAKGQELIAEEPMEFNGMNFTLQAFKVEQGGTTLYTYNYIELIDSGNFVVTVTTDNADFDTDLNSTDNPAGSLLSTLQVN